MSTPLNGWLMRLVCSLSLTSSFVFATTLPAKKSDAVRFVVGNDIWQPGKAYAKGHGWLALICTSGGCQLSAASLKVTKNQWQGHYDEYPTDGQQLRFSLDKPVKGRVVAWFQTNAHIPWLKPGPVPTFAKTTAPGPGTLETQVALPGGGVALLVPLLARATKIRNPEYEPGELPHGGSFLLQLRAEGKRQMLSGELGSCSHELSRDYLLWAGDLDRDGKADYLISFIDAEGPVQLYLSGSAQSSEIATYAGGYESSPYGGECDGEGWLN